MSTKTTRMNNVIRREIMNIAWEILDPQKELKDMQRRVKAAEKAVLNDVRSINQDDMNVLRKWRLGNVHNPARIEMGCQIEVNDNSGNHLNVPHCVRPFEISPARDSKFWDFGLDKTRPGMSLSFERGSGSYMPLYRGRAAVDWNIDIPFSVLAPCEGSSAYIDVEPRNVAVYEGGAIVGKRDTYEGDIISRATSDLIIAALEAGHRYAVKRFDALRTVAKILKSAPTLEVVESTWPAIVPYRSRILASIGSDRLLPVVFHGVTDEQIAALNDFQIKKAA